jgi:hypothetical protein
MLAIRVSVALSQAEVDDEDGVLVSFCITDEEVIRLDISVDHSLLMNLLNPFNLHYHRPQFDSYHLMSNEKDSLQVELSLAALEDIFKAWSKHVHDHYM